MSGPSKVTIQPRNKPPKPSEVAAHYQNQNAAAQASAVAAQVAADAPTLPPEVLDNGGQFVDPDASLITNLVAAAPPEVPTPQPDAPAPQVPLLPPGNFGSPIPEPLVNSTPKPPATRQEFQAQQRALNGPYPDIADIFTGKTGEVPLTGLVQPLQPAPPPPPVVRTEVVVKHELPDKQAAYKCIKETTVCLDGIMTVIPLGQIIYDVNLIDQLLTTGCDNFVPAEVAESFIRCPACRHEFPPSVGQSKH